MKYHGIFTNQSSNVTFGFEGFEAVEFHIKSDIMQNTVYVAVFVWSCLMVTGIFGESIRRVYVIIFGQNHNRQKLHFRQWDRHLRHQTVQEVQQCHPVLSVQLGTHRYAFRCLVNTAYNDRVHDGNVGPGKILMQNIELHVICESKSFQFLLFWLSECRDDLFMSKATVCATCLTLMAMTIG